MLKERRQFIKNLAITSSLLSFNPLKNTQAAKSRIPGLPQEEEWQLIREQFLLGDKRIYMNNGTSGPSPIVVVDRIKESLMKMESTGELGKNKNVRTAIANFIGANEIEIGLTHNTTEGINIAAFGVPLSSGDEIIMTSHEHAGNALPWINRAQIDGLNIRSFDPDTNPEVIISQILKLINSKTKVIAIPHISCTTGMLFPIKEICRIAAEKNIITVIDGAHGPGQLMINVKDLGCDIYVSCGHKWLCGPKGTGFIYVNEAFIEQVRPTFLGAEASKNWSLDPKRHEFEGYADGARRYFYGTQNTSLFDGLETTIDFHHKIGVNAIEENVIKLSTYLKSKLNQLDGKVKILSSEELNAQSGITTFKLRTLNMNSFYQICRDNRIRVRMVKEANLNAIRVSTHIYNSKNEIDLLVDLIDKNEK